MCVLGGGGGGEGGKFNFLALKKNKQKKPLKIKITAIIFYQFVLNILFKFTVHMIYRYEKVFICWRCDLSRNVKKV